MTQEELQAQREKFSTYAYRKAQTQAAVARQKAEADLLAQGHTQEEVDAILG